MTWKKDGTYLRAAFETPLTLSSPNHPDEDDGEIEVRAGNAIPSVPRHNLKADVSVTAGQATIGANLATTSSQFLRADEATRHAPSHK